jgi:hypothetical protein
MPVRTCDFASDCPPDQPLDNFSSEADDPLDYISTVYKYIDTTKKTWNRTICGTTVTSTVSQADADLHAAAASCPPCEGVGCSNDIPVTFCNAPQTACVLCADGSSSTCFTVPGGLFCGFLNQESADSAATNFAGLISVSYPVCIGPLSGCTCVGSNYSRTISAGQVVTWQFVGGSLPPGLTFFGGFASTATITGIPTTNGQYTFRLRATSLVGTFTERTFTITVLEITTTTIPGYTIGVPYSYQLVASGGSGSYNWKIASGSLPAGLTMSLTGLISGTPL